MRTRVTFRHMDSEPDLENHANTAIARVVKALEQEPSPRNIDLVLEPGRLHAHHAVELLVSCPDIKLVIKEEGPHMYQLIDLACDIAYRKIHEHKKKAVDARKREKKI